MMFDNTFTLPFFSLVTSAWPLMLAAIAAGMVDSMGGGGGLITVPTLLNLGVPPVFLLGTNKVVSCFGSIPALLRYRHAQLLPRLDWKIWTAMVLFCGFSAAGGAFLSQNEAYLARISLIVPALLVLVMAFMIKRWFWDEKKQVPASQLNLQDRDSPSLLLQKLKGIGIPIGMGGISFYDGLLGPGTGAFFMNLLEHQGIKTLTANATTKVFNLASNLGALIFFASQGRSLWHLGLIGAFSYALGNYLGAGFVLRRGQGIVRTVVLSVTTILLLRYLYRYFS